MSEAATDEPTGAVAHPTAAGATPATTTPVPPPTQRPAVPTPTVIATGTGLQVVPEPGDVTSAVFRLPRTAYLIVLFVLFGAAPVAFTSGGLGHDSNGGLVGSQAAISWQTTVLIIPVLVAVFIARWATFVDDRGIRVRVAFGSRLLAWDEVRGLAVEGRTVYAVVDGGAVRLPCVHVNQLAQLARASAGRLPQLRDPKLKAAPSRRRR
ncbi:MAG: PH domain-containing protein [Jatrophihabitans sp.]|uniref:PH domain-containing protein n=1 Tax=Jatrophihabitans sp. TaxID=1932789 RepID=UPI003F7E91A3